MAGSHSNKYRELSTHITQFVNLLHPSGNVKKGIGYVVQGSEAIEKDRASRVYRFLMSTKPILTFHGIFHDNNDVDFSFLNQVKQCDYCSYYSTTVSDTNGISSVDLYHGIRCQHDLFSVSAAVMDVKGDVYRGL